VTPIEFIGAAGGGGVVVAAGLKLFQMLFKSGGDVAQTALKEVTRRRIASLKLSGDATKDISKLAEWTLNEFHEQQQELEAARTSNAMLKDAFDRMKESRENSVRENTELVRQITSLVEQAKILGTKLATKEIEFARLTIEHEGAKARLEDRERTILENKKMIGEMQSWLDDANAEHARLEAENERLRARSS
jgi:chromosome segregation ATPase